MHRLKAPGAGHVMGTDQFGRDIFARLLYGARLTLAIALSANLGAMAVGTLVGLVAGYVGGRLDLVLMQAMEALLALPSLILGLLLVAVLGPSAVNMSAAIALTLIPAYARVARAPTIAIKEREYIASGRALGYSDARLMFGHVLPNMIPECWWSGRCGWRRRCGWRPRWPSSASAYGPPTATWGA